MKLSEAVGHNKILWVDDLRNPPADLQADIARTYDEAVRLLSSVSYDEIYLDHDLGDVGGDHSEKSGYDVVLFIVQRKMDGFPVPSVYHFLTANPVGRDRMKGVIQRYLV